MKEWEAGKNFVPIDDVQREARKFIKQKKLYFIAKYCPNRTWIQKNIISKPQPLERHKKLLQYLEEKFEEDVRIPAKEVRHIAAMILEKPELETYKKFRSMSRIIKRWIPIECIGEEGKENIWIKK